MRSHLHFTLISNRSLTQIGCVGHGGTCPQSLEETGDCELEALSKGNKANTHFSQEEFAAAQIGLFTVEDPSQQAQLLVLVLIKQEVSFHTQDRHIS